MLDLMIHSATNWQWQNEWLLYVKMIQQPWVKSHLKTRNQGYQSTDKCEDCSMMEDKESTLQDVWNTTRVFQRWIIKCMLGIEWSLEDKHDAIFKNVPKNNENLRHYLLPGDWKEIWGQKVNDFERWGEKIYKSFDIWYLGYKLS